MLWSYFNGLNVSLSDDTDIYYTLFIYYKAAAHHDVTEYMNVGHGLYGCRQNQRVRPSELQFGLSGAS